MKTSRKLIAGILGVALLAGLAVNAAADSGGGANPPAATQSSGIPTAVQHPPTGQPAKGLHFAAVSVMADYNISDIEKLFASGNLDAVATFSRDYVPKDADMVTISRVAALGPVQAGSFEARFLSFSAQGRVRIVLWLKSVPGGTDLIYPEGDNRDIEGLAGSQKDTLYTVPNFLAILRASDAKYQQARQDSVEKRTAMIAENQRKATSGEDTTTVRLKALQTALNTALTTLQQAPDSAKEFFAQTISDLGVAQADVAQGLDYVKAHPEADKLTPPPQDEIERSDGSLTDNLGGWVESGLIRSVNNSVFPILPAAVKAMGRCLTDFIGQPTLGIAVIGELGGQRDMIMRDVAAAENTLATANQNFMVTVNGHPPPAVLNIPANPLKGACSLSGSVVHSDGRPGADAVVTFMVVDSLNFGKNPSDSKRGRLSASLPGAIADKNGAFTIRNLSPGFYTVTTGSSIRVVIEVKEGTETKLPMPLILRHGGLGGG